MLVLAVDTSTPAVTAALVRLSTAGLVELVAQRVSVDARAHGELLGPGIQVVLATAGARPGDLAAVVAGLGPGPFTGLRVGLVTAASFGQALGIPTYGVCSLDGIGAATSGVTLVATEARRKEVYWAVYVDGVRRSGPAVNRPADIPGLLTEHSGQTPERAVGDGAPVLSTTMPVRLEPRYPDATVLARLAAERIHRSAPSEALTPIYLRRPDAVEPGARKLVRQ
jgi:tRNA threonylcarbamoyl adenosine modification protein YeaZ